MVGPDGRIYVTDVGNQAVFVFDELAGKLSIWRSADENSSFISPLGITPGALNEILVADAELGRIVRLESVSEEAVLVSSMHRPIFVLIMENCMSAILSMPAFRY
jgi:sugar lactone lactonase YvrE